MAKAREPKQAKAQEKEQEQRNGILGSFTKTLCN